MAPSSRAALDAWLRGPVTPRLRLALGAAALLVLYAVYGTVGIYQANADPELHTLPTAIDAWVPLVPPLVLAYLWMIPQALLPLALVEDRRVVLRGALGYASLTLSGLPFWLLYPVTVPRGPVPVVDLFTWGIAVTRYIDPPTNCFPSMHVAAAFFSALLVRRLDRSVGRAMLVGASLVWLSTLALDQHWFVDGLAGLGVALLSDHVTFRRRPLPADALRAGPRSRVAWVVAFYGLLILVAGAPWWFDLVEPAALEAAPAWSR